MRVGFPMFPPTSLGGRPPIPVLYDRNTRRIHWSNEDNIQWFIDQLHPNGLTTEGIMTNVAPGANTDFIRDSSSNIGAMFKTDKSTKTCSDTPKKSSNFWRNFWIVLAIVFILGFIIFLVRRTRRILRRPQKKA